MKICTIVGNRPQFIKTAIFSNMIRFNGIDEKLIHTGQHYDFKMSQSFFNELEIPKPDYNLNVGLNFKAKKNVRKGGPNWQIGEMLTKLDSVLKTEKPDLVVVFGDTNSTLAGALCASNLRIPIAHIEAGIRSYDRSMPEEINRIITDQLSNYLFCTSEISEHNLLKEGCTQFGKSFVTGDIMFDVMLKFLDKINEDEIFNRFNMSNGIDKGKYILLTIHRAGNTNDIERLHRIIETMVEISENMMPIFFPIHPRTYKLLSDYNFPDNLILCEPVTYKEMLVLEKNSKFIITDSGGVQRESFFLKKPSLILRDTTEWVEIVSSGWSYLVDDNKELTLSKVQEWLSDDIDLEWYPYYGEGKASDKIVEVIRSL